MKTTEATANNPRSAPASTASTTSRRRLLKASALGAATAGPLRRRAFLRAVETPPRVGDKRRRKNRWCSA